MKKAFDTSLESEIITKINELYITNRKKYLKLNKNGVYQTVNYTLHDGIIEKHLQGIHTIGIFSGRELSKFICFDIDMSDKSKTKWVYYLLMDSLYNIGIDDKYIHVANSGNKGLHILIYVQDGYSLKHFKELFIHVMECIQSKVDISIPTLLHSANELKLQIGDICFIEYRPNHTQGVKLELGINFKNENNKTNKCWFVDKYTLESIKNNEYILSIDPIAKEEFTLIMERLSDNTKIIECDSLHEQVGLIKQTITEPHSHKINKDENETITHIVDLINNGLSMTGTRHNSVLKIAKYFRYMGLELEETIHNLCDWMTRQDEKLYSASLEEAISECVRLVKVVYEKEYSLVGHVENLRIYKSEMKAIVGIKEKYDKVLLYTMLLHSKRYALKNGVFYMTYAQMTEMCGISDEGANNIIKRLKDMGFIEVVERNIKIEHTNRCKPNKYRITLNVEVLLEEDEIILEVDNKLKQNNYDKLYYQTVIKMFANKELKHLPTRQYNEFTKLRKSILVG